MTRIALALSDEDLPVALNDRGDDFEGLGMVVQKSRVASRRSASPPRNTVPKKKIPGGVSASDYGNMPGQAGRQ